MTGNPFKAAIILGKIKILLKCKSSIRLIDEVDYDKLKGIYKLLTSVCVMILKY